MKGCGCTEKPYRRAGQLRNFSVSISNNKGNAAPSEINGSFSKYSFSINSQTPLHVDDKISFKIPAELKPAPLTQLNCKPGAGLEEIECSVNKQIIEITIKKLS